MKRYLPLTVGAFLWVVADQITKYLAVVNLHIGPLPDDARMIRTKTIPVFETWWDFRMVGNRGAAWGLFGWFDDSLRVPFFVVVTTIAVAVIVHLYRQTPAHRKLLQTALTFILGGAIGNLIDRVWLGYVIDFIHWFYGSYHWPTFNVADVAISVGVGMLILDAIIHRHEDLEDAADPPREQPQADG